MLTIQQLAGAAERLRAAGKPRLDDEDALALLERARDRLATHPFVADPLDAFRARDGDKERILAAPSTCDRLIEEALRPLLERSLEPRLETSVHSWRPGRSTWTAALALRDALARGETYLLACDIASYFDSIDHGHLRRCVDGLLPAATEILMALAGAPLRIDGALVPRDGGLPLGRPLSPLLANAYLVPLDQALASCPVTYLRYGDDLLLAAPSPDQLVDAETQLRASLAELGLALRADKTRRSVYDGAPIEYLGHRVDANGVWERVEGRRLDRIVARGEERALAAEAARETDAAGSAVAPHNRRAHTLYVTEPGLYLTVRQGCFSARRGRETVLEVPLHRIDRVLVMAGVALSSALVSSCVAARVPVVFFVGKGRAFGSLVASGMPNPLRLRAQYDLVSVHERRTALARDVVRAKIAAMRRRLANVPDAADVRAELDGMDTNLDAAADPAALRGYEGAATRAYYRGFAMRIRNPAFAFVERTRRPPKDPINSLMSFAYSLLFFEMQTALLSHGLDPHPALLHDLRRNHPALASDLIEPYRALVSDSFVLSLVNKGQVDAAGFERQRNGGLYMADETRRTVVTAWEGFVGRPAGGARGTTTPRALIDAAALGMLAVVLGEREQLELPLTGSVVDNPHRNEHIEIGRGDRHGPRRRRGRGPAGSGGGSR